MAYSVEISDESVFCVTTNTRYNAESEPLVSVQKSLISNLSDTLESKNRVCFRFAGLSAELCMHLYTLPR
jgi:hypothetical protein